MCKGRITSASLKSFRGLASANCGVIQANWEANAASFDVGEAQLRLAAHSDSASLAMDDEDSVIEAAAASSVRRIRARRP